MRRLRRGLSELYAYFERNESLRAHLARDAEVDPPTRDIVAARIAPALAEIRDALADGLVPRNAKRRRAALDLALEFHTWRSLVRRSGLSRRDAVEVMVAAVT